MHISLSAGQHASPAWWVTRAAGPAPGIPGQLHHGSLGALLKPWAAKNHSHPVMGPYLRAHQEFPGVVKHL